MLKAIRKIVKVVVTIYASIFLILLGMIFMTTMLLSGLTR